MHFAILGVTDLVFGGVTMKITSDIIEKHTSDVLVID